MSKETTQLRFCPETEGRHRRVDASGWSNIYVIGDVHGCYKELQRLLNRIDPREDELLVFVGDLVRKGPDSESVVERVRGMENAITVRGNNEQKVIEGQAGLGLSERHRRYLRSLPVAISWDGNLVVHGGVSPDKPLDRHQPEDLMETRSVDGGGYDGTFWFEGYDGGRRVFFGHTVLEKPIKRDAAVGLDTGCVYGGALSAYDSDKDMIISVESERTYRERNPGDIVSPEDL